MTSRERGDRLQPLAAAVADVRMGFGSKEAQGRSGGSGAQASNAHSSAWWQFLPKDGDADKELGQHLLETLPLQLVMDERAGAILLAAFRPHLQRRQEALWSSRSSSRTPGACCS